MLLAIDIGNTSIAFGLFEGKRLAKDWRLATRDATANHLHRVLKRASRTRMSGICISSVVPRLDPPLRKTLKTLFHCPVLFVGPKNAGIKIRAYNPKEVGADRLVNAVSALQKYKGPIIIVDFGTATTFDLVTAKGEYAGGVIAPGIETALSALSQKAAKLPNIKIKKPRRVVGQKTKESMRSGLFYGYVGLVDYIVKKISEESKIKPKVIATGGLAKLIGPATKTIKKIHPFLTLEGLRIIWERTSNMR